MSSEAVISARGLSKAYKIFRSPEDRLKQFLWPGRRKFYDEFWAVKDLDLEVFRGETLGVVGRNGSGKSTLLQLVCGVLKPSRGELRVRGKIAPLLELSAGFNPEFTGRENVFLKAALLGLSQEEIKSRFDNIAAFADIGPFIDQPVKTYSSGMYSRLAFAVAINVDPEVMVIDEVLAVGDEAFQRKCFSRIKQIRDNGATILFVSHSAGSILELCDRAVLMEGGEKILTAKPKTVVARYQKLIYAPPDKVAEIRDQIKSLDQGGEADKEEAQAISLALRRVSAHPVRRGEADFDPHLKPKSTVEYISRGVRIENVRFLDASGRQVNVLVQGHKYTYTYQVLFDQPTFKVRFGSMLKNVHGVELGGLVSHPEGDGLDLVEAGTTVNVEFKYAARLAPGVYFMNAGVLGNVDGEEAYLHRILDAIMIRVKPFPGNVVTGMADFSCEETYCSFVRRQPARQQAGG